MRCVDRAATRPGRPVHISPAPTLRFTATTHDETATHMRETTSTSTSTAAPYTAPTLHATTRYERAPADAFDGHTDPGATVLVPSSSRSRLDAKVLTPALAELWTAASLGGVACEWRAGRDDETLAALAALVIDGVFDVDVDTVRCTGFDAVARLVPDGDGSPPVADHTGTGVTDQLGRDRIGGVLGLGCDR